MDVLSNLFLQGFDLLLKVLLPFILIGILLMMAGRKPDTAIDAAFGLFGLILGGAAKLIGLFVRTLGQALFAVSKPKYVPSQPGSYGKQPRKSPQKLSESYCQNCSFSVLPGATFCHNCGCTLF